LKTKSLSDQAGAETIWRQLSARPISGEAAPLGAASDDSYACFTLPFLLQAIVWSATLVMAMTNFAMAATAFM
jgi:hypothetical protein